MSNFVDTVEDRFKNAVLTACNSIVAPMVELAIGSKNASSRRYATIITRSSECGEH